MDDLQACKPGFIAPYTKAVKCNFCTPGMYSSAAGLAVCTPWCVPKDEFTSQLKRSAAVSSWSFQLSFG